MKVCGTCRNQCPDSYNACPNCGNPNLQYIPDQQQNMQQPMYGNGQPIMGQMYNNTIPVNNNKKGASDIIGAISSTIALYYSYCIVSIIKSGITEFINNTLTDPEYDEIKSNPLAMAISICWVALLGGVLALILGIVSRKKVKHGLNLYNIIGGIISLACAIISIVYIYNYLS